MYIFKAGVVGAGTMGGEIAQLITYSGLPVVLKDIDQGMLDKGMAKARSIYQRRVDKGKMSVGDMESKLDLIVPTLDYAELGDVDRSPTSLQTARGMPKRMDLGHVAAEVSGRRGRDR